MPPPKVSTILTQPSRPPSGCSRSPAESAPSEARLELLLPPPLRLERPESTQHLVMLKTMTMKVLLLLSLSLLMLVVVVMIG